MIATQFPIGIDPERFIQALETDQVKQHIVELLRFFAGRKVLTEKLQSGRGCLNLFLTVRNGSLGYGLHEALLP